MSLTRLVITAVVIEKRPVPDVAAQYGVSRSWLYELLARYRVEGEAAFEARSRRPKSSPNATPAETVDLIIELRQKLTATGLDAGPETISWHLQHHHGVTISRATVARRLAAARLMTPEPKKRPRSSYIRFAAQQPNERWQADFTHYRVTGPIVVAEFRKAVATHGIPASTLTDNGMVFTTRLSGGSLRGTRGRNGFEHELHRLGVVQKNSRPNHPTTCGKVERFQQTMNKGLAAQPEQPSTVAELQTLLDAFVTEYNHHRPHRSLPTERPQPPPTRPVPRPPQ